MAWSRVPMTKYKMTSCKYGAQKVKVDGITFDSKKEARRYSELKILEKANQIHDLRMQVKFLLIPAQREKSTEVYQRGKRKGQPKEGKVIEKEVSYYADFVYYDQSGKMVVEDTKGFRTTDYIIKRKLMLWLYKVRIREV